MAAVVTTTTVEEKLVFGNKRVHRVTFAYDTGDYAAGGVAVTAAQCGLNTILGMFFEGVALEVSATPTAQLPRWNQTTSKIQYFQGSGTAGAVFPEKGAEAFGAGAGVTAWVIGH
jgi:hypothetical protein